MFTLRRQRGTSGKRGEGISDVPSPPPIDRTRAGVAITMLEEVIEALQKRQLEYTPFAA
jgi:hypothetical protein